MCSAFCAVGSAMFTMVASSTTISWAMAMTPSASQRRGSGVVCGHAGGHRWCWSRHGSSSWRRGVASTGLRVVRAVEHSRTGPTTSLRRRRYSDSAGGSATYPRGVPDGDASALHPDGRLPSQASVVVVGGRSDGRQHRLPPGRGRCARRAAAGAGRARLRLDVQGRGWRARAVLRPAQRPARRAQPRGVRAVPRAARPGHRPAPGRLPVPARRRRRPSRRSSRPSRCRTSWAWTRGW